MASLLAAAVSEGLSHSAPDSAPLRRSLDTPGESNDSGLSCGTALSHLLRGQPFGMPAVAPLSTAGLPQDVPMAHEHATVAPAAAAAINLFEPPRAPK